MAEVILENIYKSFPSRKTENIISKSTAKTTANKTAIEKKQSVPVLSNINLKVQDGEFMVLVGPSGCGKSTLLRLIAGLEELTAGNIFINNYLVNNVAPKARDIAMVFQNYALYPHLNVYENMAFGLRRTGLNREKISFLEKAKPSFLIKNSLSNWLENLLVGISRRLPSQLRYVSNKEKTIESRVRYVAELLQIESLLGRLPKQLSGGQRQRVALGRAIARNPQVFLMDEPLSNLDAKLRASTRAQIVRLQRQLGITTIYVTHDRVEAMTMGDRIAVMNAGEIQQIAPPLEIYRNPVNIFVAEFIGSPPMNFLTVEVKNPLLLCHPQFSLSIPDKWEALVKPYVGRSLILGIRPEDFEMSSPDKKSINVKVDLIESLGNDTYISVTLVEDQNCYLQVRINGDGIFKLGESLWLSINSEKIHLFDPDSTNSLQIK